MGLWSVVKNVATLGGAYRLDRARERYAGCQATYERIVNSLTAVNTQIDSAVERLRSAFAKTKRRLVFAESILHPTCLRNRASLQLSASEHQVDIASGSRSLARRELGSDSATLVAGGAAIGTTAAIAAWQGVQLIGMASTGTAIGGIYGAAASNAGWAAFGGGSLATGGGGMAAGHLVLPGIGTAIAIGFAAYSTHSKATEIHRHCDEFDEVNAGNEVALSYTSREAEKLLRAEASYLEADRLLSEAEVRARRVLRRFGWFSVFYRYLRYKFTGVYYAVHELPHVRELEGAVQEFLTRFGAKEAQS